MLLPTPLTLVAVAVCMALGSSAQSLPSNESTSVGSCPQNVRDIADGETLFNSTGSISFEDPMDRTSVRMRDDWYLSMLLSDIRVTQPGAGDPQQLLDIFLSAPGDQMSANASEAQNGSAICGYRVHGVSAVSEHPENHERSCQGVLSDECVKLLESFPRPAGGECQRAPYIESVCGVPHFSYTRYPISMSNSTCTLGDLPHVDLPLGYRSRSTNLGGGFRNFGQFDDETYDLRVRQSIPIVLTGRRGEDDRDGWSRVICLAPDEITRGSREPEGDFPGEAERAGGQSWMALVAALGAVAIFT